MALSEDQSTHLQLIQTLPVPGLLYTDTQNQSRLTRRFLLLAALKQFCSIAFDFIKSGPNRGKFAKAAGKGRETQCSKSLCQLRGPLRR